MPDVLHPAEGPDGDDDGEEQGLDDGDFVEVASADDGIEADLLRAACEDAGIPAIVRAPRQSMVGKIDAPSDSHTILVRNLDLEKARALIAERKAQLEADPEAAARAAEEEEAEEEAKANQPKPE
jgi:hypothetical protein